MNLETEKEDFVETNSATQEQKENLEIKTTLQTKRKRKKWFIILFIIVLMFLGGISFTTFFYLRFPYKSYNQYLNAPEEQRFNIIQKTLDKSNITCNNKFIIKYIDFMINQENVIKVLERQNPEIKFKNFFEKSIPIIYYSYNNDSYKSASIDIQKKVQDFIINYPKYYRDNREDLFRDYLKDEFKKGNSFVFNIPENQTPDKILSAENYEKEENDFNFYFLLSDKMIYSNFKSFSTYDQAFILKKLFGIRIIKNKKWDDENNLKALDYIEELWIKNSNTYLNDPKMLSLQENASLDEIGDAYLSIMFNYN